MAQVANGMLGHAHHEDALPPGRQRAEGVHRHHQQHGMQQPVQVAHRDVVVNRHTHEKRTQQVRRGSEDHHQDHQPQIQPLALEVIPQAAQGSLRIMGMLHRAALPVPPAPWPSDDTRLNRLRGCVIAATGHVPPPSPGWSPRCPTAIRKSRGRWGWSPAGWRGCPPPRSAPVPAPESYPHPAPC